MRTYKKCGKCVDDITCDICGTSCRVPIGKNQDDEMVYNMMNANLKFDGCYGSFYDTMNLRCDMCQKCFEKVRGFIISIGGQVREEYAEW